MHRRNAQNRSYEKKRFWSFIRRSFKQAFINDPWDRELFFRLAHAFAREVYRGELCACTAHIRLWRMWHCL